MAEEALGVELDRRRPAARAHKGQHLAHGVVHREEIGAIGAPHLHAKGLRAAGDVFRGAHRIIHSGVLGIMVVLEHEDAGSLRHHGHVHRLESGALIAGTVAGKGDGDLEAIRALAIDPGRERRAHRDGGTRADNAIGTQHPLVDIGNVHRAALALAQTFAAAPDFGHHAVQLAALGQAMAMAAMGGDDLVLDIEVLAHAHGHRFLPAIEVGETSDLAGLDFEMEALLEFADHLHLTIGALQRFPA